MPLLPPELRHLYPFKHRYFTLRPPHGADATGHPRVHYIDEGQGPVILLLHGNPTWSFYYRELIKGLADRYRVIAPDHMGCGLSDKPRRFPYTLRAHIDNLEQLIDHLQLDAVTLGVHDWGGPIGLGWAVRHPQRAARFVVFNTAAFLGGPLPLRIRACRWPILGGLAVRGLNAFAEAAVSMACKHRERMTPEVRRGYLLPYDSYATRIAILRFIRDIPLSPKDPSYDLVKAIDGSLSSFQDRPMIIFWGALDFCFNDWYLQEWTSRFPAAAVHRFENAGHYVVEDAHELILPLVRRFLEETSKRQNVETSKH